MNICYFQFYAVHKIVTIGADVLFLLFFFTFCNVHFLFRSSFEMSILYNLLTEQFYVSIILFIYCAPGKWNNKQVNKLCVCAQHNMTSSHSELSTKWMRFIGGKFLFAATQYDRSARIRLFFRNSHRLGFLHFYAVAADAVGSCIIKAYRRKRFSQFQ